MIFRNMRSSKSPIRRRTRRRSRCSWPTKKGLKLDGNNPTLLYGYGGFNVSLTPSFGASRFLFLEKGGLLAIANLRGGGEYGEEWHQAGMLGKKQNVFDDFLGAAEWLIEHKYTNRDKLAIQGGSNGGLLMGAALTQRPDLFRAVVCQVPLLDMLRYHKFLIARLWIPEYGSADNAEQFKWLYAYSPYHHVKDGTAYPAVLIEAAESDGRVDPLHARKMAARLQAATSSDRADSAAPGDQGRPRPGQAAGQGGRGTDRRMELFVLAVGDENLMRRADEITYL